MTDKERAQELIKMFGSMPSPPEIASNALAVAKAYLAAQAEIKRLQQLYDDDVGTIATEAQILTELVEDNETADHLISELPTVAFYIATEKAGEPTWRLVYGKKIRVKEYDFGVWFNGSTDVWSVTDFETGLSVTEVNELVEAEVITGFILDQVGIEEFKQKVQMQGSEAKNRYGTCPGAPRVIWQPEQEGVTSGD